MGGIWGGRGEVEIYKKYICGDTPTFRVRSSNNTEEDHDDDDDDETRTLVCVYVCMYSRDTAHTYTRRSIKLGWCWYWGRR